MKVEEAAWPKDTTISYQNKTCGVHKCAVEHSHMGRIRYAWKIQLHAGTMGFLTISRFKTETQTWTTSQTKACVCWLLFCFLIKMHCLLVGCCQPDTNLQVPGARESSLRKYLHRTGLKANLWGIVLKWKVPAHIDRGTGW